MNKRNKFFFLSASLLFMGCSFVNNKGKEADGADQDSLVFVSGSYSSQNEPVELVTCPYFTTSVYDLSENMTMDYSELDSFVIYICMEGACSITDNEGNTVELQAGESVLFPATTKTLEVVPQGKVKFLETYV